MSSQAEEFAQARPWTHPWWRPARKKEGIFFYLIAIHLLAVLGLILFPLPPLKILLISVTLAFLGGLGTSVCYHRALAHKALKLNRAVEAVLIFFTILNGNGSPLSWVANHRQHHTKADTIEDVSSPRHGGFWWAHLRWIYQWPQSEVSRWCPELDTRYYRAWLLLVTPIIIFALTFGLYWGWAGLFWLGAIRLVYALHLQMVVNSLLHMSPGVPAGQDSSRNIWWIGPFQLGAWGENWHRNHHNAASVARFGRAWQQIDIGWYFILLLERLQLARDVRRPI